MLSTTVAVLQIVVPFILIARLFEARRRSMLAWTVFILGVVIYVASIAIAGVWLALPWYTGLVYLLVVALASKFSTGKKVGATSGA